MGESVAPPVLVEGGPVQPSGGRMHRWTRIRTYGLNRHQLAWALFLPSVIVLVAVLAYPAGRTIYMGMTTDRLDEPWLGQPFTWFRNYHLLQQQPDFWNSLEMSAYFTVGCVVAEFLLGMIVALVVNESFRGRGLMRAAMLVPWAIPVVLSARLFQFMYDVEYGPITSILRDLHLIGPTFDILASDTWAMPALIFADVWKNTPFVALLLLAGLQSIPSDLYESARVDGANALGRFTNITLPLLRGSIAIALLFRTIGAFQTFDLPYVLTQGGPGTDTEVLSLHAYRTLFSYVNFGLGSAMSTVLALICIIVAAVLSRQLTLEQA